MAKPRAKAPEAAAMHQRGLFSRISRAMGMLRTITITALSDIIAPKKRGPASPNRSDIVRGRANTVCE